MIRQHTEWFRFECPSESRVSLPRGRVAPPLELPFGLGRGWAPKPKVVEDSESDVPREELEPEELDPVDDMPLDDESEVESIDDGGGGGGGPGPGLPPPSPLMAAGLTVCSIAPSWHAKCYLCGIMIANDSWRLHYQIRASFSYRDSRYIHLHCTARLPIETRARDFAKMSVFLNLAGVAGACV